MKTVMVMANQNLVDIALQEYGHPDMTLQIVQDNQDKLKSVTDPVYGGMELVINEPKIKNPRLVKYWQNKNHRPATGDEGLHKKFKSFNSKQFSRTYN